MNESSRVIWWQSLRRSAPLQQFGQANDSLFFDGRTACAAAVLQTLAKGWLGTTYTLNTIARMVGYPATTRQKQGLAGLTTTQIAQFCGKVGLPYELVVIDANGWTPYALLRRANTHGPVMIAYRYGHQPEWYGRTYGGVKADGKPNGYASPLGKAGKTQLVGFEDGSHLGLLLGNIVHRNPDGSVNFRVASVFDPNHGSKARPEKPPYDDMKESQWTPLARSLRLIGRTPFAFVPTRVFAR